MRHFFRLIKKHYFIICYVSLFIRFLINDHIEIFNLRNTFMKIKIKKTCNGLIALFEERNFIQNSH